MCDIVPGMVDEEAVAAASPDNRTAVRSPVIKDVAREAGVSPMTVSRSLGDGKGVRPEVREHVLEVAARIGYHRNENARSIRPGHTSGLIGVAITHIGNPYYGNVVLGIEDVVGAQGKRLLLGTTGEDPVREAQLVSDLIGRQVEGLIVVPSGGEAEHLRSQRLLRTPLVLASRLLDGVETDAVVVDDVGGAIAGVDAALDRGLRRIAYLGYAASTFTGERRFDGFRRALAQRGVPLDEALVRRDLHDIASARRAAGELLDLASPPDAIFCANNRSAVGALEEIGARREAGRTGLPTIVSFDRFELADLMPVPVVIIDHDGRELGRQAGRLLLERLAGAAPGEPQQVEIPAVVRG